MKTINNVIDIGNLEASRPDELARMIAGLINSGQMNNPGLPQWTNEFTASGKPCAVIGVLEPVSWTREFAASGKDGKSIH